MRIVRAAPLNPGGPASHGTGSMHLTEWRANRYFNTNGRSAMVMVVPMLNTLNTSVLCSLFLILAFTSSYLALVIILLTVFSRNGLGRTGSGQWVLAILQLNLISRE